MSERNATLSKLERVPKDPPPAEESVRQIVSSATACENPRHRNKLVSCIAPGLGDTLVSYAFLLAPLLRSCPGMDLEACTGLL